MGADKVDGAGEGTAEVVGAEAGIGETVGEDANIATEDEGMLSTHMAPPAGRGARCRWAVEAVAWPRAMRARSAPSLVSW